MSLLFIIIASLAISLLSFIGGLVLLRRPLASMPRLVSFAAGVMLAVAFLDLLPEALAAGENGQTTLVMLAGVVLFFFLERFLLWFHHHDEGHGVKPSAALVLWGDALHNFIDGIAIAAAFLAGPGLGLTATIAIAAHEIPQEIADLGVLLHAGLTKSRALFYNFASALTALGGALLGYFFLAKLETAQPYFLAFAAGMFIYISCSDLIPDLHTEFRREKRWAHSLPFLFGIFLIALLSRFLEA
ncbi:MAG: ZIP family metal transporter [Candidatus Magasanikbacteria bacterium]|nr:ZIP family metal transporter [Candidatus Magasanikbacteria bacterium]